MISVRLFPVFLSLNPEKQGGFEECFKTGVIASAFFVAACIVPFIVIDSEKFFRTYMFHIVRLPEGHSLVNYLDTVFAFLINLSR